MVTLILPLQRRVEDDIAVAERLLHSIKLILVCRRIGGARRRRCGQNQDESSHPAAGRTPSPARFHYLAHRRQRFLHAWMLSRFDVLPPERVKRSQYSIRPGERG